MWRKMSGQTSHGHSNRGSTDRELWSEELAWFLTEADAALGQRSTMGAVVAVIEHGGVIGSADSDSFHGAMINRIEPKVNESERDPGRWARGSAQRHRVLAARWHRLDITHRRVLVAHYVGKTLATRFESQLGDVAAVAAQLWLEQQAEHRGKTVSRLRNVAEDGLEAVYEELARLEPLEPAWYLETWEVRLGLARAQNGFLACSAAGIALRAVDTQSALRRLRSERDALLGARAIAPRAADLDDDLNALDAACKRRDVDKLRAEANELTRAAHRAWNATSGPKRERTKREARAESTNAWMQREGLT